MLLRTTALLMSGRRTDSDLRRIHCFSLWNRIEVISSELVICWDSLELGYWTTGAEDVDSLREDLLCLAGNHLHDHPITGLTTL
jgi:hypothetical protein